MPAAPVQPQPPTDGVAAPSRRARLRVGIGVASAVVALVAVTSVLRRPPQAPPDESLRKALALVESNRPADRRRAVKLATELLRDEFRDPEFPAGPDFVLGIAAAEDAAEAGEIERERHDERAVRHLREAEHHAMPQAWRPRWAYALGVSLHRLGLSHESRPLLEEALETYPPGRFDAAALVVESTLDQPTPESLARTLELSASVVEHLRSTDAAPRLRETAVLRQVRVLLATGRLADADALLASAPAGDADSPTLNLVRAQSLMARRTPDGYRQARQLLAEVVVSAGLDQSVARQAGYLAGLCHERLGELAAAVDAFERTARKYAETHEGLAARLRSAELLRLAGRNEEALAAYRGTLAAIARPEVFRNRWLTLDELRRTVVAAWNDWVDAGRFEEASELSRLMPPTVPRPEAAELQARTRQRWAEHVEAALGRLPLPERRGRREEMLSRWRDSGRAYADLAVSSTASPRYSEHLWTSAEQFRRGEDFRASEDMLEKFLTTGPVKLLPLALVRSGQCLLALDRRAESRQRFERVLDRHPTDPAAFEAAYWLGVCHLENGEPTRAEDAWRRVLRSPDLTPAAEEWRLSLFALGRLLHCGTAPVEGVNSLEPPGVPTAEDDSDLAGRHEAADRLDEYLRRYPESAEADEARFLLAKTYRQLAENSRRQARRSEVDTERQAIEAERQRVLRQADTLLTALLARLTSRQEAGELGEFDQRLLRDAHLESADVQFALGNHEAALARYTAVLNRYPNGTQVLSASMQMADCYDRLGRPEEGRSMLQQARIALRRLPDEAFDTDDSNLRTRGEWEAWLDWAVRLRDRNSNTDK